MCQTSVKIELIEIDLFALKYIRKMSDIINKLRRFDAYPKTADDCKIKTFSGAASNQSIHITSTIQNEIGSALRCV